MLLGTIPLVVLAIVLVVLLGLRLNEASAPLRAATLQAQAVVVSTGLGADGRQIAVEYTDESGTMQTGRLTLDDVREVPLDARIDVAYDPDRPAVVYVRGDALSNSVNDLLNGVLVIAAILIGALAVTVVRLVRRRRSLPAWLVRPNLVRRRHRTRPSVGAGLLGSGGGADRGGADHGDRVRLGAGGLTDLLRRVRDHGVAVRAASADCTEGRGARTRCAYR
jgi:hypothetical protein